MTTFRRGYQAAVSEAKEASPFFEFSLLPDAQKEDLCRALLAEFGVSRITKNHKQELIHSCCLPNGMHKNGDRNPSAGLNFHRLTYKCLGCGSGGGLLWFIATCRGDDDTAQARAWLAEQSGLGQTVIDLDSILSMLDRMYAPESSGRAPIPRYDPAILTPWTWPVHHPYLTTGAPEFGVTGRNIPESTLDHFRVGYAEKYIMGRHLPTQERIVIPHFWDGRLVGWQARRLNERDEPKYKNSLDFPKDQTIFNYQKGIRAIVVEAPMSTMRHYHHLPEMQATFSASLTEFQLRLLQRMKELVLWFDNDPAGWKATRYVGEKLSPYLPVWVVDSPYAADPADFPDDLADDLSSRPIPYVLWEPPTELVSWEHG
jgi:hypothetical protein